MSRMRGLTVLALGALALAVSACSLLSTPDPVQMYRFGGARDGDAVWAAAPSVEVSLRPVEFLTAARGDRILSVTGTEAAYIAGARWVSPAEGLFTDALEAAFAESSTVRLIGRREVTPADHTLDVDVTAFEARYAAPGATPDVVVTARVRLLNRDRSIAAERAFSARSPASANRVSAIVEAFDAATLDINGQIVTWVEANVGR